MQINGSSLNIFIPEILFDIDRVGEISHTKFHRLAMKNLDVTKIQTRK